MSNRPQNLDIYDSQGPPAGFHAAIDSDSVVPISGMQDISTFGIAGRIWDSSYTLDLYMRRPTDQYTFTPACPISPDYFLPSTYTQDPTSTTLLSSSSIKKKPIRILEIGAGTGYVGIALAKRLTSDCTVILTDLEEVVPLMQKNVKEHGLLRRPCEQRLSDTAPALESGTELETTKGCAWVQVEPLAWGNSDHARAILKAPDSELSGPIDIIIASDLVYFPELYPPLLQTLKEITYFGGPKVLFGYKERALWKESPFWEEFGRFFEIDVVRIERHRAKTDEDKNVESKNDDDGDDNDDIGIFGCDGEDRMYVFVATRRRDEDVLKGADDTLVTLMMMQIGI